MLKKKIFAALLMLPLAVGCSGCMTTAQVTTNLAASLSSSTPVQVTTFEEATAAADLATKGVKLAIDVHTFPPDVLRQLGMLNDNVHECWVDLKDARDANRSLTFTALNAALKAFRSYAVSEGVKV